MTKWMWTDEHGMHRVEEIKEEKITPVFKIIAFFVACMGVSGILASNVFEFVFYLIEMIGIAFAIYYLLIIFSDY